MYTREKQAKLDQYVQDHFIEPVTRSHKININRLLRAMDDSQCWPICGEFNATNRAISRYNRLCNQAGMEITDCVYSYVATIDQIISDIVNDPNLF